MLTLSRTGQKNQAHSIVAGHNWLLSASLINSLRVTYNKTLNDRPLPEYFTATDLGSRIVSPLAGYVGVSVTGNGFAVGAGATNPGYFNSDGYQIADDVDFVRGDHQISFGGNWIHTKIETLNNRPTNGAFTFNGQGTGLSLADFMLGVVSGGFLQGNPVYDYDNHDYIGAYVQDDWRVRPNLSLNVGVRWEPFIPLRNTFGWVSHFDQSRFDQGLKSHGLSAGAGRADLPGRRRLSRARRRPTASSRSSRRASARSGRRAATARPASARRGASSTTRRTCSSTRGSRTTRRGARRSRSPNPAGGWADPYLGYPGRQPVPGAEHELGDGGVPGVRRLRERAASTSSRPRCISGTSACSGKSATGCVSASYLGNHSVHLWRATELNPAVFGAGRDDRQHQPAARC